MPALPSSNLTCHIDPSTNAKLFKTYVSGGPNTGTPVNGDQVKAIVDESIAQQFLGDTIAPTWMSTTPSLRLPCLDFDSNDKALLCGTTGTEVPISALFPNNAFTILVAVYINAITAGSGTVYNNNCVFADNAGYMGLFFGNDGSGNKISVYNYDGSVDRADKTTTVNTQYVVMIRHESGNIYISLNGGAETSAASGNTASLAGTFGIGQAYGSQFDGQIGELAVYSVALSGALLSNAITYFTDKWLGVYSPGGQGNKKGGKGPKGPGGKQVYGLTGMQFWDSINGFGQ